MLRLGVLVSGGGTNLQAILDGLPTLDAEVVAVVSSRAKAYALTRAEKHGVDSYVLPKGDFEPWLLELFREKKVDLIVLAGFLRVLSAEFVAEYENRIINVHPALIPSFCGKGFYGLRVHEAVLESGVKVTGATVHFADAGTDTGPIILQKPVFVKDDDTPETLQLRVMKEGEQVILLEAIRLISSGKLVVCGNIVRRKD